MKRETSRVQFGTTELAYTIERRPARSRSVSIRIEGPREIVVFAPTATPKAKLDTIVRAKATWILKRLRATTDRPPAPEGKELVSGETFLYAGRQRRLRVVASMTERVVLEDRFLVVYVRAGRHGSKGRVRALLVEWFRARAEQRLTRLVQRWAPRIDVEPKDCVVVEQRRRWGSCTPDGVVRLNWRIVGASPRLMEYVVAHELVHLQHADHTPAFWRRLGEAMPDYEARRERLREVGADLVW